jgi:hypothetical protein
MVWEILQVAVSASFEAEHPESQGSRIEEWDPLPESRPTDSEESEERPLTESNESEAERDLESLESGLQRDAVFREWRRPIDEACLEQVSASWVSGPPQVADSLMSPKLTWEEFHDSERPQLGPHLGSVRVRASREWARWPSTASRRWPRSRPPCLKESLIWRLTENCKIAFCKQCVTSAHPSWLEIKRKEKGKNIF